MSVFNKKLVLLAVVAGLTFVAAIVAQGAVYDLANDFSTSAQSGPWSYGYRSSDDGLWHQYATSKTATTGLTASGGAAAPNTIAYWYDSMGSTSPQNMAGQLFKNTSSSTIQAFDWEYKEYGFDRRFYFNPGMVINYAAGSNYHSAPGTGAEWTAAVSGTVHVSATFSMQTLQWNGQWASFVEPHPVPDFSSDRPQNVKIAMNGTDLATQTLNGFAGTTYTPSFIYENEMGAHGTLPVWTYTGDITVAAGDTLDFLTMHDTNGNSLFTGMNVTITTQDAPEPSSLIGFIMFGSGMGFTAIRRIRRK